MVFQICHIARGDGDFRENLVHQLFAAAILFIRICGVGVARTDLFKNRVKDRAALFFHLVQPDLSALRVGVFPHVFQPCAVLGKDGGYIVAPTSNFQNDMPMENIVNFASIVHEFGTF